MAQTQRHDATPLTDLTAFQRDILVVLAGADEPLYGLGLCEDLEAERGEDIPHSRLYTNLDTLVEKGLVEKGSIDRRTNSHELTSRGERELRLDVEWRSARVEG